MSVNFLLIPVPFPFTKPFLLLPFPLSLSLFPLHLTLSQEPSFPSHYQTTTF
ncbi:hypothetical protein Gotur_003791 [Gossypium turneri]